MSRGVGIWCPSLDTKITDVDLYHIVGAPAPMSLLFSISTYSYYGGLML